MDGIKCRKASTPVGLHDWDDIIYNGNRRINIKALQRINYHKKKEWTKLTSFNECNNKYCLLGVYSISLRMKGRNSGRFPTATDPRA